MRVPLAIVGNGAAAAESVLALRANGYERELHLFADNQHAPYNPMLGTYLVSGAILLDQAFPFGDERGFYGDNRVDAHLGEAVVRLDAVEQLLTTQNGAEYRYDRCLVASGARPSVPPIPGLREALGQTAGRNVFTIQYLEDVLALKEAVDTLLSSSRQRPDGASRASDLEEAPRAAVIGASFAGLKVAAVLHDMGLRVCLVEREPHILPLSAHPDCARLMETHLLESGYELRLGAALASVQATDGTVRLNFGALPGAADPGGLAGLPARNPPPKRKSTWW